MKKLIFLVFFAILFLDSFYCEDIVVNSRNGLDIGSAASFANIHGGKVYVIYRIEDVEKIKELTKGKGVILIQGNERAYGEYNEGAITKKIEGDPYAINLALGQLADVDSYILMDDGFAYQLVVLLPYAKITKAYILYANEKNSEEILSFFEGRKPKSVLLYGYINERIKEGLEKKGINYEEIYNEDKYLDNIELVKRYQKKNEKNQFYFATGEALEESLIESNFPVLLVGQIIPKPVQEFIESEFVKKDILVGIVIGNEITQPVYNLKKELEYKYGKKFPIYLKFGQAKGNQKTPGPLTFYNLPKAKVELKLHSVNFNSKTKDLEVIYENIGNVPVYAKGTIQIFSDGNFIKTVGDKKAVFIAPKEKKGIKYKGGELYGDIEVNITTYYGVSKNNFEKVILGEFPVGEISYEDKTEIEIMDAKYHVDEGTLTMSIKEKSGEDALFKVNLELFGREERYVFEDEELRTIKGGTIKTIRIPGIFGEKAENGTVTISYGGREGFIEKKVSSPVKIEKGFSQIWVLLAITLLIIIIYVAYKKKKERK